MIAPILQMGKQVFVSGVAELGFRSNSLLFQVKDRTTTLSCYPGDMTVAIQAEQS